MVEIHTNAVIPNDHTSDLVDGLPSKHSGAHLSVPPMGWIDEEL